MRRGRLETAEKNGSVEKIQRSDPMKNSLLQPETRDVGLRLPWFFPFFLFSQEISLFVLPYDRKCAIIVKNLLTINLR